MKRFLSSIMVLVLLASSMQLHAQPPLPGFMPADNTRVVNKTAEAADRITLKLHAAQAQAVERANTQREAKIKEIMRTTPDRKRYLEPPIIPADNTRVAAINYVQLYLDNQERQAKAQRRKTHTGVNTQPATLEGAWAEYLKTSRRLTDSHYYSWPVDLVQEEMELTAYYVGDLFKNMPQYKKAKRQQTWANIGKGAAIVVVTVAVALVASPAASQLGFTMAGSWLSLGALTTTGICLTSLWANAGVLAMGLIADILATEAAVYAIEYFNKEATAYAFKLQSNHKTLTGVDFTQAAMQSQSCEVFEYPSNDFDAWPSSQAHHNTLTMLAALKYLEHQMRNEQDQTRFMTTVYDLGTLFSEYPHLESRSDVKKNLAKLTFAN